MSSPSWRRWRALRDRPRSRNGPNAIRSSSSPTIRRITLGHCTRSVSGRANMDCRSARSRAPRSRTKSPRPLRRAVPFLPKRMPTRRLYGSRIFAVGHPPQAMMKIKRNFSDAPTASRMGLGREEPPLHIVCSNCAPRGVLASDGYDANALRKAYCVTRSEMKAERQGFEPWVPFRAHRFSRPAQSATLSPLRNADNRVRTVILRTGGAGNNSPCGGSWNSFADATSASMPLTFVPRLRQSNEDAPPFPPLSLRIPWHA